MKRNNNKKWYKTHGEIKKKFKKKIGNDWKSIKLLEELQDPKQEARGAIKHQVILRYPIWNLEQQKNKSQIFFQLRRRKIDYELNSYFKFFKYDKLKFQN